MLLSVAQGKKKLQLEAGERRLSAHSKDREISIFGPEEHGCHEARRSGFLGPSPDRPGAVGEWFKLTLESTSGIIPEFQAWGRKKATGMMFGKKVVSGTPSPREQLLESLCEGPPMSERRVAQAHV